MSTIKEGTIPQPLVHVNNWITIIILLAALVFNIPLLALIPTIYFGLGAFFGKNPIISVGKLWVDRYKDYVLEDVDQLKFNSLLAFIMLALALVASFIQLSVLFYTFVILCLLANLGSAFGYCVGCFIRFQWKQFQYKRSLR